MISKIRHQTCQTSDFHTECYMKWGTGGGGGEGGRFTLWSQISRAFYAVETRDNLMF